MKYEVRGKVRSTRKGTKYEVRGTRKGTEVRGKVPRYEEKCEGGKTAKGGNEEHDFRSCTGRSTSMRINKGRYEERSTRYEERHEKGGKRSQQRGNDNKAGGWMRNRGRGTKHSSSDYLREGLSGMSEPEVACASGGE